MKTILRIDVRCASQAALLGIVTNNLNALTITMLSKELIINFYYDNAPSQEEIHLSKIFSKKIALDLSNFVVKVFHVVLKNQQLIPINKEDQWVFYRQKEKNSPLFKIKTFFNDVNLASVKSASQFALLGCVTSNLRAVSMTLLDNEFILNFYYDKKLDKMEDVYEWGFSQSTFANIISSFKKITGKINRFLIPEPEKLFLEEDSFWIYMRYEKIL